MTKKLIRFHLDVCLYNMYILKGNLVAIRPTVIIHFGPRKPIVVGRGVHAVCVCVSSVNNVLATCDGTSSRKGFDLS